MLYNNYLTELSRFQNGLLRLVFLVLWLMIPFCGGLVCHCFSEVAVSSFIASRQIAYLGCGKKSHRLILFTSHPSITAFSFVLHHHLAILLTQVLLVVTFSLIEVGQSGLEGNTAVCRRREGMPKVSSSRSYMRLLSIASL